MKKLAFLVVGVILIGYAPAQNNPDVEVESIIYRLFKGMHLGDSAMVRSTFTPDVQFATIEIGKDGDSFRRVESSSAAFLKAVGSPRAEAWNEEIWNLNMRMAGDLAQAWCDYAFFIGKRFSHCGVDAFLLHKVKGEWKIFYLADTRRTSPCAIPKDIESKYN
jgi:hypothetical protein